MRHCMMLALALASLPTATSAPQTSVNAPACCVGPHQMVPLAMRRARFSDIAGTPQQGGFNTPSLPLTGWSNCSLYGASTSTCASAEVDTAEQPETAQATILQEVKA